MQTSCTYLLALVTLQGAQLGLVRGQLGLDLVLKRSRPALDLLPLAHGRALLLLDLLLQGVLQLGQARLDELLIGLRSREQQHRQR